MKIADTLKLVLTVLLMGASIALAAFDPVNDDTDIFLANPQLPAERPNVLIVLDNTANWNQAFENEKVALKSVVDGLTNQYNLGLMMFPETGAPNDAADGGYVRYHVREMNDTNRAALSKLIGGVNGVGGFDINSDKGNNATTGLALHEAYLYFSGKTSIASHGKVKTDKPGTVDPVVAALPNTVTTGTPPTTKSNRALPAGTTPALYNSPVADGCQRNFIIYISNGPANENAQARADLEGKLAALTGMNPPAVIGISPSGMQSNWADEMAKFMANADVYATSTVPNSGATQNVYTYTIEVDPTTTGAGPDMTALMKSVADNGKGKYFSVSSGQAGTALVQVLNEILLEVQAVNSVFASTTLPVSVNVRGTNLNQVYIGVFRPDPQKSPRWLGNLKMYNLALNSATGTVFLADASNGIPPAVGDAAENSSTGFITNTATSFWTQPSTFWQFRPANLNGPGGPSDKPDGDLVEKGGAAQHLRVAFANAEASSPVRQLYTCTTGLVNGSNEVCAPNATPPSQLSKTPFSTANDAISAGSLQLDTRLVSPLSAYQPQSVFSITDRLPAAVSNTYTGTDWVQISNFDNGSNNRQIIGLSTAVSKTVSSLSGKVANTQVVQIASVVRATSGSNPTYQFNLAANRPSNFVVGAAVTVSGTQNSTFNGTWQITATTNTSFTISASLGNSSSTGGTASVTAGTVDTVVATAVVTDHGFSNQQTVTIQGASPPTFNGTYNVSVIDANRFTYNMTVPAGDATPAVSGGTILASAHTSIATATTLGAHTFAQNSIVNIFGASQAAYNGAKTIIDCLPAASCAGASTFRYSVGTPTPPNTNSTDVWAIQGGNTTVTVSLFGFNPYAHNDVIHISGSNVPGYNGTFNISCAPLIAGLPCLTANSFQITTASVLPPDTSQVKIAARSSSANLLLFAPNHGFQVGDSIVLEGPAPYAGTYPIISTLGGSDWFIQVAMPAPEAPITQTNFTIRPATGNQAWVTVSNFGGDGYTHGQTVRLDGASPAGYNTEGPIRKCPYGSAVACWDPARVFIQPLTSLPGPNTSFGVTASIKSTTARATSVNHGFTNGSTVVVAGATPPEFNGSQTIQVVNNDTFTYTLGSAQGTATGAITAFQTGGFSAERDALIRWVRGEDNLEDENSNSSTSDIRASVHGDVLHSRPAVINYNRYAGSDDDVFIFYGGNDGVFHAVKGGYAIPSGDSSGITPGREVWGFVPEEFFSQFKRLRNNSPAISSFFKKPYFMDGPIGVYTKDTDGNGALGDSGDIVNLYIANRRGGRFLYALDVNSPTDPKFLWKVDPSTTGFSELGQTWSQPTVVPGLAGISTPVLVFGAGYDAAADDLDPAVVANVNTTTGAIGTTTAGTVNRTMGRGVYVVNALTGALIWSAGGTGSGATVEVPGMIYAIPSDMTLIRNESGGAVNRAYVGDTGGNLWRIDFKSDPLVVTPNLNLTTVTKLAAIADQSTAAGRRKFMFPPDVVGQTGFDAVLIGSGDREHPFDSTVTNRFYMFKDKGSDVAPITGATTCDPTITEGSTPDAGDACAPNPGDIPGMSDLTLNCIQDPTSAACVGAGQTDVAALTAKLGTDRGWFITLGNGEKVVGNAISIGGTTFFNTNQPSATAGGGTCGSNLGIARQYQVATADATATSDLNAVGGLTGADRSLIHAGGGYLPSPVHVVVMLGGKPVEAVISGIQVSTPQGASLSARLRKYWYREVDQK